MLSQGHFMEPENAVQVRIDRFQLFEKLLFGKRLIKNEKRKVKYR